MKRVTDEVKLVNCLNYNISTFYSIEHYHQLRSHILQAVSHINKIYLTYFKANNIIVQTPRVGLLLHNNNSNNGGSIYMIFKKGGLGGLGCFRSILHTFLQLNEFCYQVPQVKDLKGESAIYSRPNHDY